MKLVMVSYCDKFTVLGLEEKNEQLKIEEYWAGERHIPVAISLKFTEKVAELKMEHRGESLMQFMRNHHLSQAELYVFAFEMGV